MNCYAKCIGKRRWDLWKYLILFTQFLKNMFFHLEFLKEVNQIQVFIVMDYMVYSSLVYQKNHGTTKKDRKKSYTGWNYCNRWST